jgi:hypothetical protein
MESVADYTNINFSTAVDNPRKGGRKKRRKKGK